MALCERLMGLNDDGTVPNNGYNLKIPVHGFFACGSEVMAGALTVAAVKAATWPGGGPAMRSSAVGPAGKSDTGEFDALAALFPGAGSPAQQALFMERVHGVFMLAEIGFAGYTTPAMVRAKLGLPA